jgi:predicted metal-dependent phosphoesterase TrpH
MTVLIDFHTHSTASDGALDPLTLVQRAADRGIDAFAITDHDTVAGYRLARSQLAGGEGVPALVPGAELSCRWSGTTIHVVGLGMDIDHPALAAGLHRLDKARLERGAKIAERLARHGMPGALDGALAVAGDSQLGRPHFAQWMVAQGHVESANEAFDRYLGQGKIGDVKAFWPELAEVTGWIVDSGGVAIVAHPLKYRYTRTKLRRLLVDFQAAGGQAMELVCGPGHKAEQRQQLERLARELELSVSAGSDFHRDGPYAPELGVELRHLAGFPGVWEMPELALPAAVTE